MAGKTAVLFVYVWPEARSSAAGVRTHELIGWLQADGYRVAAVSPSKPSSYSQELEAMGVATLTADPNQSGQDEALRGLRPSVVLFDRFVIEEQFGWKARALWPAATFLVDTQDLHSVRRAREALLKAGASAHEILRLDGFAGSEDLVRELASLYRADGALVVSAWEENFLRERCGFPAGAVLHLPFTSASDPSPPAEDARRGFAFLGNFRHPPNLDGILWFVREIWLEFREADPAAELHLYGAYPPAEISALHGKNGIVAHGPVEDHRAALARHLALVAPLRFGAGIKGKVLEAWGTGTPVLGTAIAFEGMTAAAERVGLFFEDAASFRAAATGLRQDWSRYQAQGLAQLARDFSEAKLREKFFAFIEARGKVVAAGRTELIGAMLRHGQNNATKYFSRWIEAKNEKRS